MSSRGQGQRSTSREVEVTRSHQRLYQKRWQVGGGEKKHSVALELLTRYGVRIELTSMVRQNRPRKVKRDVFGKKNLVNNFWTVKDSDIMRTLSYSSRPDASKCINGENERLWWKLNLWSRSRGKPFKSSCKSVDTSWRGKHIGTIPSTLFLVYQRLG